MRATGDCNIMVFMPFLVSFISKPFKIWVGVSTADVDAFASCEDGRHAPIIIPAMTNHTSTGTRLKEALPLRDPVRLKARSDAPWRPPRANYRNDTGAGPA